MTRWNAHSTLSLLIGLFAFSGCSTNDSAPSNQSTKPAEHDPTCVVATWSGGKVTLADVETLKNLKDPPPSGAAAAQWAIDVHLASSRVGVPNETASADTPAAKLASYQSWLDDNNTGKGGDKASAQAIRKLREELREEANLQPGPCIAGDST